MSFRFRTAFLILPLLAGAARCAAPPEFLSTLYSLCDGLLATQSLTAGKTYGALVCPSTNPDNHPTHSRAAEAVYPFAVAYKRGHDAKYADAAAKLGDWLITVQNAAGA
jgi:hypothetical protein